MSPIARIVIPIQIPSAANLRQHYMETAARTTRERNRVKLMWPWAWKQKAWKFPVTVTTTRIARRKLDKHDNLPMALKHVVDEIANQLGVDDGDEEKIEFKYFQENGTRAGIRIEIEESK